MCNPTNGLSSDSLRRIMPHSPVQIKEFCLSFPQKVCFQNFTTTVEYGGRIARIGRIGSGKSTLPNVLGGVYDPNFGNITNPVDAKISYVSQIIENFALLSDGQRFSNLLTGALSIYSKILLMDEPMNDLDIDNRKSLIQMLQSFSGTLIVASHDTELLRNCIDTLDISTMGKFILSPVTATIIFKALK
jgi:ATPase subunit of ABC transporter with duplicated ATPase domains